MHRQAEARAFQCGILADVIGGGLERVERSRLEDVIRAFPRLNFKREFLASLHREADSKLLSVVFHPSVMIAHHCLGGVSIPDVRPMILAAGFDE